LSAFACAHRGLSAEVAENTLAAFRAAIQAGFPSIECDLRTTADGEVVVLHDSGLERTTHGSGRVGDLRYDELRRHPTEAGPVPRLDDVLAELKDWHGLWNLEIKALAATNGTIHLLEHHHALGHAQVSSMDPRALHSARAAAPDLPRGLITVGPLGEDELRVARDLECRWINADHEFLDAQAVGRVHEAGLRLAAWTVNDPQRALELSRLGVECVITDARAVHEALRGSADPKPYF
jgi:glycerophosphoryl diester phosphodiesterase